MKRAILGSIVAGAVLFGGLQFAGANSKTITDSDLDAVADATNIVEATHGHKRNKLVHTVTFDGPVDPESDDQVLLQFNLDGDPEDCETEYIWPPSGKTDLIKCGVGELNKPGKIKEVAPDKLKFVFKRKIFGHKPKYRWRVITRDCQPCAMLDAAHDEDGGPVYVKHQLK
jgi:hypothetical protein